MSENEKEIITEQAEGEKADAAETADAENAPQEKDSRSDKKKTKKLEGELEKQTKLLEEKQAELDELNDKYLRMMAEYDNFRRRSVKEREGIHADAFSEAITAILPVIDNLERAANFTEAEKVHEGVAMTLKSFCDTMEKLGIEVLGTVGETFDPELHNAVMHEENEELGESVITDVFQKGYKMGDKVIRYAMVKVAN